MSLAPQRRLTPQEYLEIERNAPTRSEFYRGEMFAMSGACWEHSLIKDNLSREAGLQLRYGPCRVVTSDLRVKIPNTGLYTYPDVIVVCDPPQFEDDEFDTLLNPGILIEVLSDSTEKDDRGLKFANYRQLPSMAEYVLVAQDKPLVERYVRQPGENWVLTIFDQPTDLFEFTTVPVQIALTEIYRGIEFRP